MAKYPGRSYTHQYGSLMVTVQSRGGEYGVTIRRPSDGYEIGIGTPEQSPLKAARYALWRLVNVLRHEDVKSELYPAALELGPEIEEFIDDLEVAEDSQLGGQHRPRHNQDTSAVSYQVCFAADSSALGAADRPSILGRTFASQRDAEAALLGLYQRGNIRSEDRDSWGVEQVTSINGRGEVRRIRVS